MEILKSMLEKFPGAATNDYLLDRVYGGLRDVGDNVVRVHISYMRRVLEANGVRIEGGKGRGYRLILPAEPRKKARPR